MKNKIISCFILFVFLFLSCSSVFATNVTINPDSSNETIDSEKSILELVERNVCEINLNDMGNFKKELTDFDAENKELTITLTVTNTMEKEEIQKPVEIYLVLDNSQSMTSTYQDKQKIEYVKETASLFTDAMFEFFTDVQIGVVSFSSVDTVTDPSATLGTSSDAQLLLPLSNSSETVKNSINTYGQTVGPYTNIEAGLELAQSNFSDSQDSEKYVILISDGVPNLSLDTENTLTYSGVNAQNTKNKLQEMQEQGYHIFSVLMRLYERDVENPDAPTVEGEDRHMTYGELAEEIFGTAANPTSEYFYFIDYEDLSTTVNDDIFDNITTVKDNTLKNIVIKDYFPQEIVDNFDFEYVTEPNIGTISETIDTSDNSITWNIPQLAEGEVATVSYKLKLKEQYDADIVDQILPTNTNVDIDFETAGGSGNAHSDVSPKIRLTYEEVPQKDPDGNTDNTVANTDIPQTGNNTISILAIAVTAVILFALSRIVRIKNLNKTK